MFYLVPVLAIMFNIFPVNNSLNFAIGSTVYICMIQARPYLSRQPRRRHT